MLPILLVCYENYLLALVLDLVLLVAYVVLCEIYVGRVLAA